MKKKTNWGYYLFMGLMGILLALGILLLIAGLKSDPDPLTMPWSVSV